ncbi:MAG: NAD(P)/FAD-dependent oxidoreductase [Proteobacteria bacterium]|nr:NAD(P)/FAD-dependent oxidoreductase [Pseudomonadota bacterium]
MANVAHAGNVLEEPDFDPEALKERYRVERDRRLRPEASGQYVPMTGRYAHYLDDPYADPNFTRDPITEDVDVLIMGGGFGGLLSAARLQEAGIRDIRIIEKAGDFGGTWYWNRYPGAACDTESYIYMPLLEETGYMPTSKYAKAPELYEHCRRIGRHYDLYPRTCFQTVVREMRWNESRSRWVVTTDRGDTFSGRFVILAGGTTLGRPKLPGVPGIDDFKGHTFHTSRWDYDYTGGGPEGGLVKLKDKRVGIIGTGATAVQCVPHLGEWAKELYVFQRTPSSVDVRADRPTDPDWAKSLKPGWHKERIDNFTAVISGGDFEVDLVNDGWTDLIGNILLAARRRAKAGEPVEDPEALVQLADYQTMERVRARVDSIVQDRATAAALKPWYNQFCKRPCFHDTYLPTFNRPNVHLIDTKGKGVERLTEAGVVVDGKEYPLDCLIYATGFEVGTDYANTIGFEIYGRGGQSLTDRWKDGAETLHSIFTRGFPNCFVLSTRQSGQSANFQHMLDEKAKHIAFILGEVEARGIRTLEPTAEAEAAWVDNVVKLAIGRRAFLSECTPGYYNNEGGELDMRIAKNNQYWRGPVQFVRILERWRKDGSLPGLELTR